MPRGRFDPNWRPTPGPYFSICNTMLGAGAKLSAQDRAFLEDVRHARNLSPKQHRYLHLLIDRETRDKPRRRRVRDDYASY